MRAPLSTIRKIGNAWSASLLTGLASIAFLTLPFRLCAETTSLSGATEITSLPWTIWSSGVYFLSQNLGLTTDYTNAITIQADGVTIDFDGHTISGMAGGSNGVGVLSNGCSRLTVRNGVIRGLNTGVSMYSVSPNNTSYGNLVEDMRFIDCTITGVAISANGSTVRHCEAARIGGFASQPINAHGIQIVGNNNTVLDCDITGLLKSRDALPLGIYISGSGVVVVNNRISGASNGIYFDSDSTGKYRDNLCAASVATPYAGGTDAGNN